MAGRKGKRLFSGVVFRFRKLWDTKREAMDHAQGLRGKDKHARVVRRRKGHAVYIHRGRIY